MKHRLIRLDNEKIKFELDGETYELERNIIENKFGIYWFMADLYRTIIKMVVINKEWLSKYKT